jgi:hypothetical protein
MSESKKMWVMGLSKKTSRRFFMTQLGIEPGPFALTSEITTSE